MKIFRKFRKGLLKEGKFKSYLMYAVGEILLIAVGVLIAWKINNLNEVRKSKIVEVKIYESLYEELHTNLNVIDSAIVRYGNNALTLQNSFHYLGQNTDDLTQQTKDLILQIKFENTNLRDDALNSINNTNKFEFIENESLKGLIAKYPNEINIFKNQEMKISTIVSEKLKPVIERHISLIDMLPEDNKNYKLIKTYGKQSNYSDLLNSREYQNSVIDRLLQTQIQLKIAKNLRNKTETLAIKLKQELKG